MLSYIAGESVAVGWYRIHGEQGLRRFVTLLREYHEAVSDFRPTPAPRVGTSTLRSPRADLPQRLRPVEPSRTTATNRSGSSTGTSPLPGPGRNDVTYALEHAVPFRDDATSRSWSTTSPTCSAPPVLAWNPVLAYMYGTHLDGRLVDDVIARQRLTIVHVEELAARGSEPQATWVRDGTLDESRRLLGWAEENRVLFS